MKILNSTDELCELLDHTATSIDTAVNNFYSSGIPISRADVDKIYNHINNLHSSLISFSNLAESNRG